MIHPFYSVSWLRHFSKPPCRVHLTRVNIQSNRSQSHRAEDGSRRFIEVHSHPSREDAHPVPPGIPSTAVFGARSMGGAVTRARRVGARVVAPADSSVTLFTTAQLLSFTMSLRVTPSAGSLDYGACAEGLR
jgi:hypothetical protein